VYIFFSAQNAFQSNIPHTRVPTFSLSFPYRYPYSFRYKMKPTTVPANRCEPHCAVTMIATSRIVRVLSSHNHFIICIHCIHNTHTRIYIHFALVLYAQIHFTLFIIDAIFIVLYGLFAVYAMHGRIYYTYTSI
jgi:hypothetical protein